MMQNPIYLINQFMQFKRNFTGNPRDEVMKLLQSGQISQSQLNDLQRQAKELEGLLNNYKI